MQLGGGVLTSLQLTRVEVPIELQANFAGLRHTPLFYAGYIQKLNRKGKVQKRVLIYTLDHVYFCHPNGDILRCFPFSAIEVILWDPARQQMAFVVPSEYDVAFASSDTHGIAHVTETIRGLHNCRAPHRVEMLSSPEDEVDEVSRMQAHGTGASVAGGVVQQTESEEKQEVETDDADDEVFDDGPDAHGGGFDEDTTPPAPRSRHGSKYKASSAERAAGGAAGRTSRANSTVETRTPPKATEFPDPLDSTARPRKGSHAEGRDGPNSSRRLPQGHTESESEPGYGEGRDTSLLAVPALERGGTIDDEDARDLRMLASGPPTTIGKGRRNGDSKKVPLSAAPAPPSSAPTGSFGSSKGKTSSTGGSGANAGRSGGLFSSFFGRDSSAGGKTSGTGGPSSVNFTATSQGVASGASKRRKAPALQPAHDTPFNKLMILIGLRTERTSVEDGVDDWYHGLAAHEHCIGRGFYKLNIEKPPGFKLKLNKRNE